jgi:hypothetical protein
LNNKFKIFIDNFKPHIFFFLEVINHLSTKIILVY